MKKLILGIALSLSGLAVTAQDITKNSVLVGATAGISLSNVRGVDGGEAENRIGMHAGAVLVTSFSWHHALQLEIVYANKGFGYSSPNFESNYNLNYIDVPLLYRFNLTPKRKAIYRSKGYAKTLFVIAGPQFSTLVGGTNKQSLTTGTGESAKTTEKETNLKPFVNPFDLSLVAGIGYNINSKIMVNARYGLGLSGIGNNTGKLPEEAKNTAVQVGLTYLIPVK